MGACALSLRVYALYVVKLFWLRLRALALRVKSGLLWKVSVIVSVTAL